MKNSKNIFAQILLCSLTAFFVLGSLGCEDPLDVENPNSLVEVDLENPIAAAAIANGALATVSDGIGYVIAPYSTATDECFWIGSRDAWRELDFGNVSFSGNEFTDNAMKFLHEGRWMADKAVVALTEFQTNGELGDVEDLARSHLYAGLVRIAIAEWFDDWTFSDKTEPAPNVGAANMNSVINDAIASFDQAMSIAGSGTETYNRALAMKARAKHGLAVWGLLNPAGTTPANPWVNAGVAEAQAVLDAVGDDWQWQLNYSPSASYNDWAWQVNGRLELDISAIPNDIIDAVADPRMQAVNDDFRDTDKYSGTNYAPLTMVSSREMHLIIAESDVASGSAAAALDRLNTMRSWDGLTASDGSVSAEDLLKHERRANLFMQGRRLNDMYRFGIKDALWQTNSNAYTTPGDLLDLTDAELQSNPLARDR